MVTQEITEEAMTSELQQIKAHAEEMQALAARVIASADNLQKDWKTLSNLARLAIIMDLRAHHIAKRTPPL
jgi:uncharacterized protein YukE